MYTTHCQENVNIAKAPQYRIYSGISDFLTKNY